MIRHLFKIIWNDRKTNAWLLVEFILIFTIMWFCTDFLYFMGKQKLQSPGWEIEHTYQIQMGRKNAEALRLTGGDPDAKPDDYAITQTILERIARYPGVEYVSLSEAAAPFSWGRRSSSHHINGVDSLNVQPLMKYVTASFFDVYRIGLEKGSLSGWDEASPRIKGFISRGLDGTILGVPLEEIDYFVFGDKEYEVDVVGITEGIKEHRYNIYTPNLFMPMSKNWVEPTREISIRVDPKADKDFEARFMREMWEQLNIEPYYLQLIESTTDRERSNMQNEGITSSLNSILAITLFLMVNIFLGIIGTFWFRTQSRRGEIGLRMALGASKRRVKALFLGETVLMLFVASLIATVICVNIGMTDIVESLGLPALPTEERNNLGIGLGQDFINYGITFAALAIISLLAVWYPARQAANTLPANALRDE